jgi:CheY-like chemotaxis protein
MDWGRTSGVDQGDRVPGREPIGGHGGRPIGQPGGSGRRVLVCDDEEQIRQLIRVNLELEGYDVVEAGDGPAALEILQDATAPLPDVITMDVVMPRRDGWWMVEAIRADPRLAHIPIILVTASAQDQDRAQAERAAVDEFVSKPFDPVELLTKIEALVGGHSPGDRPSLESRE